MRNRGPRSREGQRCGIRASLLRFGRLDGIRVKQQARSPENSSPALRLHVC